MFQTKSKNEALPGGNGAGTSILASGTTFTGNIESFGDIRIDGNLIGNVTSHTKVVIGAQGRVEGNVVGQQADIMGWVKGNINVKELLQLKGQSIVEGNLSVGTLSVEMNASFNGQCKMQSASPASGANEEAFLSA